MGTRFLWSMRRGGSRLQRRRATSRRAPRSFIRRRRSLAGRTWCSRWHGLSRKSWTGCGPGTHLGRLPAPGLGAAGQDRDRCSRRRSRRLPMSRYRLRMASLPVLRPFSQIGGAMAAPDRRAPAPEQLGRQGHPDGRRARCATCRGGCTRGRRCRHAMPPRCSSAWARTSR